MARAEAARICTRIADVAVLDLTSGAAPCVAHSLQRRIVVISHVFRQRGFVGHLQEIVLGVSCVALFAVARAQHAVSAGLSAFAEPSSGIGVLDDLALPPAGSFAHIIAAKVVPVIVDRGLSAEVANLFVDGGRRIIIIGRVVPVVLQVGDAVAASLSALVSIIFGTEGIVAAVPRGLDLALVAAVASHLITIVTLLVVVLLDAVDRPDRVSLTITADDLGANRKLADNSGADPAPASVIGRYDAV
jgi:hypothetical protein